MSPMHGLRVGGDGKSRTRCGAPKWPGRRTFPGSPGDDERLRVGDQPVRHPAPDGGQTAKRELARLAASRLSVRWCLDYDLFKPLPLQPAEDQRAGQVKAGRRQDEALSSSRLLFDFASNVALGGT